MVKVSPTTKKITFEFGAHNGANEVSVVGDFNGWDSSKHLMKKNKKGVWRLIAEIEQGEYNFKYLVNNSEWYNDDSTSSVPNAFGGENSLLKVDFTPKRRPAAKKKA